MIIKAYSVEHSYDHLGTPVYCEEIAVGTSVEDVTEYVQELYPKHDIEDVCEFNPRPEYRANAWKIDELLKSAGYDIETRKLIFTTLSACEFIDCNEPKD